MQRQICQFRDIQSYLKGFPKILDNCSRDCDHCGAKGALLGHGSYRRWHITFGFKARVRVQRLLCPFCGVTVALTPHFMRVRSPYVKEVVARVLTARAKGAPLYSLPASLLRIGVSVKYVTIRSWAAKAA